MAMTAALFKKEWLKPFSEMSDLEKLEAAVCILVRQRSGNSYWSSAWAKGRQCFQYMKGEIFTPEEIAYLESEEKVPIQTPRAKTPIDAYMGMLLDTTKSGVVTSQGSEDAPGQDVISTALLAIARDNNLKYKASQTGRNVQVTSVPCWLWIENYDPLKPDEPGICVEQEPWDGVIPDPQWTDMQLRDLNWAIRMRTMSIEDVEARYEVSEARERVRSQILAIQGVDYGTASQRTEAMEIARNNGQLYDQEGRVIIAEMTHWVRMVTRSWFDPITEDHGPIPDEWTDQEISELKQANPHYIIRVANERVLWVTTSTMTGLLLANGPHWNQSGMFPGVPNVPDRIDGDWSGIFEFTMDLQKQGAYMDTEWFHSIRTLSNNLWIVEDDAVKDPDDFRKQITAPNGIIRLSAGKSKDSVHRVENTREQKAFFELVQVCQQEIEMLLVERNFQGGVQSSQESNKVVETRIRQVISRLAPQIYAYHQFWLMLHRTIVKSLRYAVPQGKVFRYLDPANGAIKEAALNVPVEWDVMGEISRVWNNLNGGDYDYIEAEADDSVTGKEYERALLKEFLEAQRNNPPEVVEAAALSYPSRAVQEFGNRLAEQRKAKEQAPPPSPEARTTLTLSGQDIGMAASQKAAAMAGFIKPEDVEQGGSALPPEAEAPTIPGEAIPVPEEQLA